MIRAFTNYQKISDLSTAEQTVDSISGFDGNGIPFKAKLIGMEHLTGERDEKECLEAFGRLKASIRIHGEHKQKVQLNVGVNGIQVIDELTKVELVRHEIRQIPFVILDPRDPRTFGYVYNTSDERHQFWAIKTERFAQIVVFALRDLFEEVYKVNDEQDPDETKRQEDQITSTTVSGDPIMDTSQQSSDLVSAFESAYPNSVHATTTTPSFDDNWGGNSFVTIPQSFQTSDQPASGNVDPWGFSQPTIPAKPLTPPRVDSPVNIVALPPPPPSSSRRQTITQTAPSTTTTLPVTNNVSIEPIQETSVSTMTSSSTTDPFGDFNTFTDFPPKSSTDDFFSSSSPSKSSSSEQSFQWT